VGREKKYMIVPAEKRKRVVIVGGGCAGLEAARVMDLMGHEVILMEKSDHLGGHLIEAIAPPFKEKTKEAFDWMVRQVKKGHTYIQLNTEPTPEKILDARPDAVILAVGSKYIVPKFKGAEYAMYADEALLHQERPGKNVVIIGGGQIGVETGMTLVENRECNVTIVEMLDGLSYNMDGNARRAMYYRVEQDKIDVHVSHRVKEIKPGTVVCEDAQGEEKTFSADTIVLAIGLRSNHEELQKYMNLGIKMLQIGDCKMVRNIFSCFHEAWHAAFHL
jgi:2-enoate reductase